MQHGSTTLRHLIIVTTCVVALVSSACGTEADGSKTPASGDTKPTSANDTSPPDDSAPTFPPSATLLADRLDVCAEGRYRYNTLPDWTADGLPETMRLVGAFTYVADPLDIERPAHSFTLAAVDGDQITGMVYITNDPPGTNADMAAADNPYGWTKVDTSMVDDVRGLPGEAYRATTPRSSDEGSIASWTEDGADWFAWTYSLALDPLLDLLGSLFLSADSILIPDGSNWVVASAPRSDIAENRVTELSIAEVVDNGNGQQELLEHAVRIESGALVLDDGNLLVSDDQRTVLKNVSDNKALADATPNIHITTVSYALDDAGLVDREQPFEKPDTSVETIDAILASLTPRDTDQNPNAWPVPLVTSWQYNDTAIDDLTIDVENYCLES